MWRMQNRARKRRALVMLVAALAIQFSTADDEWTSAPPFSCPGNTGTQCSPAQQLGYNWNGLMTGAITAFRDHTFSGFHYAHSFRERDTSVSHSAPGGSMIGRLQDAPSMSCGSPFTVDRMDLFSSHDVEVECQYVMPDQSICRESQLCLRTGSIFQNQQCGGARSVSFRPGKNATPDCSIAIRSVQFRCGPSSSTIASGSSSSPFAQPPATSSLSLAETSSAPRSTGIWTGESTCTSSTSAVKPTASVVPTTPPQPQPPSCPSLLPRCLNTWLFESDCHSNADVDCLCLDEGYITKVMGCIGAWAGSQSEQVSAAGYLVGMCAEQVDANPAIITARPSAAATAAEVKSASEAAASQWVTVSVSQPVTVAATYDTGVSAGFTIPGSSRTTSLVTTVVAPRFFFATSTVTVTGITTASLLAPGAASSGFSGYNGTSMNPIGTPTIPVFTWNPTVATSPVLPASGSGHMTQPEASSAILGFAILFAVAGL